MAKQRDLVKVIRALEPEDAIVFCNTRDDTHFVASYLRRQGMDGVIATNTTVSREAVKGLPHADEAGGLSGAPVLEPSNRVIAQLRAALGTDFPIIGVGGIMSAADAISKIRAGADLVQLYTGLIYRGPALVSEAARAIKQLRGAATAQKG